MLDLSSFRSRYPEFASAGNPLVQVMLDRAALEIHVATWETLADTGHGLLTAHYLAMAPNGQMARLAADKAETVYGKQYAQLQAVVACGLRST